MPYDAPMGRYVARLTGQLDGSVVSKDFEDRLAAITWLQGTGLGQFSDQCAVGEIYASDGRLIWIKSHLQSREQADWGSRHPLRHILVRLGIIQK